VRRRLYVRRRLLMCGGGSSYIYAPHIYIVRRRRYVRRRLHVRRRLVRRRLRTYVCDISSAHMYVTCPPHICV
jgi:hypothetical protein